MSDHLDRAAEVLWASVDDKGIRGRLFREDCDYLARALDEAGMLATPEHDAEVAALPLPGDGCACTPHEQSAGGVYTEHLLEYEPACPEHSEHLWDPKQGAWVLRSEHDAEVAAKALRKTLIGTWLHDRADRIEREAGESDADT